MQESPYDREPGYAEHYRDHRFQTGSGSGTDARERAAIANLLQKVGKLPIARDSGLWLDAPCGAGRLSGELPNDAILLDRDPKMIAAADHTESRLCASLHALPFENETFAGALCMRLLQHIATPAERIAILRELARVTSGPIILSFFDSCSLQHLRRKLRPILGRRRSGRVAVSRPRFRQELHEAGLKLLAMCPLQRFIGEQTIVLAQTANPFH